MDTNAMEDLADGSADRVEVLGVVNRDVNR